MLFDPNEISLWDFMFFVAYEIFLWDIICVLQYHCRITYILSFSYEIFSWDFMLFGRYEMLFWDFMFFAAQFPYEISRWDFILFWSVHVGLLNVVQFCVCVHGLNRLLAGNECRLGGSGCWKCECIGRQKGFLITSSRYVCLLCFPNLWFCPWGWRNIASTCFLWLKDFHSGGLGWWSDGWSFKNVCLFWAVSVFWSGFFRLLFLHVDCECSRPFFLRQCLILLPPSTESSISGTSRKLPICEIVSQYVYWRMTWRDVNSYLWLNSYYCDWRVQSGVGLVVMMRCKMVEVVLKNAGD